MNAEWPGGYAKVTIRWEDGTELIVNRVKVEPEDLLLYVEPRLPDWLCLLDGKVPPRAEKGRIKIDSEMLPDDEDVFYEFREPPK